MNTSTTPCNDPYILASTAVSLYNDICALMNHVTNEHTQLLHDCVLDYMGELARICPETAIITMYPSTMESFDIVAGTFVKPAELALKTHYSDALRKTDILISSMLSLDLCCKASSIYTGIKSCHSTLAD